MLALLFLFTLAFAQTCNCKGGDIICNICKQVIGVLDKLDGHRVKEYLENLCGKAEGFISTVCTRIADFGIDKLVELLHDKVEPEIICQHISLCNKN